MPSGEIDLDPDRAARAGTELAVAGEHMLRLRQTSGGRIEAANNARPWDGGDGSDELGKAFAGNYLEPAQALLRIWHGAASQTAQLGTDLVTAVRETVAADEDSAARLGKAARGA